MPEQLSDQATEVVVELQRVELNRLLQENERLNARMDRLVQMLEREQVLRQQMQETVDDLSHRLALPSAAATVATPTPPPTPPIPPQRPVAAPQPPPPRSAHAPEKPPPAPPRSPPHGPPLDERVRQPETLLDRVINFLERRRAAWEESLESRAPDA